jgi:hypothetical protein
MSAKREKEFEEKLRAFGAFAGGTPAVPDNHLTVSLHIPQFRRMECTHLSG